MIKKFFYSLTILFGVYFNIFTQIKTDDFLESKNAYLEQKLPGEIPELFAPGVISIQGRYEYGLAVSPEGKEIYYTANKPGDGLMVIGWVDDKWTEPKFINPKGDNSWNFEAFFTRDGKKIYFTSNCKFWYLEKDGSGFGNAKYLDSPVNNSNVMWCTFTSDETMYYGNNDNWQIHRAKLINGKYEKIENLGINGTHPSVAPDESYFLLNSKEYGGYGKSDILIIIKKNDDSWSKPINMGEEINTSYNETCASLSPDGKYIFFSRYNDLDKKCNIYWASITKLIERLKQSKK